MNKNELCDVVDYLVAKAMEKIAEPTEWNCKAAIIFLECCSELQLLYNRQEHQQQYDKHNEGKVSKL